MSRLTHLDQTGAAHMVDVSDKAITARQAIAHGRISMSVEARDAIAQGLTKKGDVLAVARVAGIMGAKKTSELIPLCHPLPLSSIKLDLKMDDYGVVVTATAKTSGQTGVEMEALVAVSTALLTIYDMAKAVDKSMIISEICLTEKKGGKSGAWARGA